jgi:hypothetical protein
VVAVLIGLASMLIVKRKAKKAAAEIETGEREPVTAPE